ncbi:DUF1868 domain-containing protein [Corynebacterium auris]|uniref:DUF1868 domain-containing protein n=1 Tax=Corynebacterium auris TaxID=44750 RepID=UPI0025B41402|nr:DUF1868 domain-containing protein [Corynebacterium auris]WJY67422.1 hypothetical protein CAURIS_02490 [Corynebacterium auris]
MAGFVDNARTWEKFDTTGVALRHPGSTFVSAVPATSPLYTIGRRIQDDVTARGWAGNYGLTVPSSFHMTVLQGLKERTFAGQDAAWPAWLDGAADFPEAVRLMLGRLLEAGIRGPRSVTMTSPGVCPLEGRLTIRMEPANDEVARELERFRQQAGEVLEIPVEAPGEYRFHTTLGYRLTTSEDRDPELGAAAEEYSSWLRQHPVYELEAPAFCIFNDMQSFSPLLYFR